MRLDAETHARLALIGLVGVILACAAVAEIGEQPKERAPARVTHLDPFVLGNAFRRTNEADAGHLAFLDRLLQRPPVAAEFKRVLGHLDHPNWEVAGRAHQVLKTHRRPELAQAHYRLIERSLSEPQHSAETLPYYYQRLARLDVLREVMDSLEPSSIDKCRRMLVQLLDHGPDGLARARAMELLATRPPEGWRRLVLAALDDPSERVRLVALEVISNNGWTEAAAHIEPLASSPRPAVRRRASELLRRFGCRAEPIEYGESVIRAAGDLANQLWHAGLELREIIPLAGWQNDEQLFIELLNRRAEDYLDRSAGSNAGQAGSQGVLLLAAAARTGQRKLTLRLWEHEIGRTDTDEALRNRGLETWARNRILAGLTAYQRGNRSEALQELTSVANIAEEAGPSSTIQVYVRQTSAISAAIWQSAIHRVGPDQSIDPPSSIDPVARLATRLLDRLDPSDPEQHAEAHRRIDAWCGLAPAGETSNIHRAPLAN